MTKLILLLCVMAATITSCRKEEISRPPLTAEEVSGARLWERISSETDYQNYSFSPNHKGVHPGQAPHGVYHKIFINENLIKALPIESKTAPVGSIIVKENMDRDEKVQKLTVMAKIEGYNEEGGNWFWAAYSPEGEVLAEGTPKGCVSCHEGMKDNDYIIVMPLDQRN